MRLTDKELDCLKISGAGSLAQRRLARGLKLNYPESVAIISSQILEFVRDGQSLDQIKELGRKLLGRNLVQKGVDKIMTKISVEATFHKDGLRIITIEDPICTENGDLDLLLHGSFLPKPNLDDFKKESKTEDFVIIGTNETIGNGDESEIYPGRIIPFKPAAAEGKKVEETPIQNEEGELNDDDEDAEKMQTDNKPNEDSAKKIKLNEFIEINKEKSPSDCVLLTVTNLSSQSIKIGSHFNFIEANKLLQFDRSASFGMRLNIPSGDCVTFEAKSTKIVPLIRISGNCVVKGGNNLVDGLINEETLKKTLKKISKRAFANRPQPELKPSDIDLVNAEFKIKYPNNVSIELPRELYIKKYGPTIGDKIILGDTSLIAEIERDFTVYGDELTFGIGKCLREGMGQAVNVRNNLALDSIITNVVIIDAVGGILKADIGIRDGMIQGVGKGGNPHTMQVTPGMVVGVGTDVICGEGLIVTSGGVDIGACLSQSKNSLMSALSSGVTTIFGGGTGSLESGLANCTPGPNHIKYLIQSTDEIPINFGIYAKANSLVSKTTDATDFPKELEDQLIAGAIGLRLSEFSGSSPASIDSCLRLADFYDVISLLDVDSMRESFDTDLQSLFKNRVAAIPLNPTLFKSPILNEILTQSNLITVSALDKDEASDEKEELLHDLGVISVVTSSSFYHKPQSTSSGLIVKTWQMADKMRKLSTESSGNDNERIKRYLAKYTINPALLTGCSHAVGSIEPNKMADLVVWRPEFFGAKPDMVLKGGQVVYSSASLSNNAIITWKNSELFGACGKSPCANSVLFISKASFELGATNTYGICKHVEPLRDCRSLNRNQHMQPVNSSPKISYANVSSPNVLNYTNAETGKTSQLLPLQPAFKKAFQQTTTTALAQKYFLF